MFNGRRQPSRGGTSRMNREVQVRICERLGVKFPGPTRPQRRYGDVRDHGESRRVAGLTTATAIVQVDRTAHASDAQLTAIDTGNVCADRCHVALQRYFAQDAHLTVACAPWVRDLGP